MPNTGSLQKEVDALKRQQKELFSRIKALEQQAGFLVDEQERPEKQTTDYEPTSKVPGILFIVIGALLSLTIIGAIIGIPLIIAGIIIVINSNKQSTKSEGLPEKKNNEKISMPEEKKTSSKGVSFEADIGLKWFARLGIAALVIGVGFFIKYAFENDWISHLTIIIMGCAAGIGLIAFGKYFAQKNDLKAWAQGIIGGGIAILYFSIFSAYHFPEYRTSIGINLTTDIVLLSLTVLFAVYISLKEDSKIITGEAFFLGYLTSLLANTQGTLTLVYILLLSIGLAAIVWYKRWSAIGIGAVIATYFSYLAWRINHNQDFTISMIFLSAYFITFLIQSVLMRNAAQEEVATSTTLLANSGLFFAMAMSLISSNYPRYDGLFVLALGAVHLLLYLIFEGKKYLGSATLYLGIAFVALAVPLEMSSDWVTLSWVAMATALTVLSHKLKLTELKVTSYVLWMFTSVAALFDLFRLEELTLSDPNSATRLIIISCFIVGLLISKRFLEKMDLKDDEKTIPTVYSWIALVFAIMLLIAELHEEQHIITIVLAIAGLALMLASKVENRVFAIQSAVVSAFTALKLIFYDSSRLEHSWAIIDERTIAFLAVIASFYIIAHYLQFKQVSKEDFIIPEVFSWTATILSVILLWLEMREFWISIGWTILGLTILAVGFGLARRHLRIEGIAVLSLSVLKVFIYDTSGLDTFYRTLSFIVLGIILLAVSYAYARYKDQVKDLL